MQQTKHGSVIYHKEYKNFYDGEGNEVEEFADAYIFDNHTAAEIELNNLFDEPDKFEIWDIEIIWRTL